jgi:hypothetical protein
MRRSEKHKTASRHTATANDYYYYPFMYTQTIRDNKSFLITHNITHSHTSRPSIHPSIHRRITIFISTRARSVESRHKDIEIFSCLQISRSLAAISKLGVQLKIIHELLSVDMTAHPRYVSEEERERKNVAERSRNRKRYHDAALCLLLWSIIVTEQAQHSSMNMEHVDHDYHDDRSFNIIIIMTIIKWKKSKENERESGLETGKISTFIIIDKLWREQEK